MHFHKVKYDTPCNFRHFGLTMYHHLIPVDKRLGEKKNKTKLKKKEEKEQDTDSNIRRYRPVDCGYWNDDHDGPFLNQPEMNRMKTTEFKQKKMNALGCVSVSLHRQS